MVRGLKDEAAQGSGGPWGSAKEEHSEGEDATGDGSVQGAERKLCAWSAADQGTVLGEGGRGQITWALVSHLRAFGFLLNAELGYLAIRQ